MIMIESGEFPKGPLEPGKVKVELMEGGSFSDGYQDMAAYLYAISRWALASVLHPIATFKSVMLIGTQEQIDRNTQRALSLPKLPIGRERTSR